MFIVASDGTGDFATLQTAVDAVPEGNKAPVCIRVKAGEYHEKLVVDKDNLCIAGDDAEYTVLWNSDFAKQPGPDGAEKGTFLSYTMIVTGSDVRIENMTIRNDAGPGGLVGQAVAVYAAGDGLAFVRCHLLAHQDTLFCGPTFPKVCRDALLRSLPAMADSATDGPCPQHRQYFEECLIRGDVDFIFGPYRCWFERCTLACNDRSMAMNGYYTAASTAENQPYGFVFRGCRLTGDCAPGTVFLGRPWRAFARTVFLGCEMGDCVHPEGWADWGERRVTRRYGEYASRGAGADDSRRHPGASIWTKEEAERLTLGLVLGGEEEWGPVGPA